MPPGNRPARPSGQMEAEREDARWGFGMIFLGLTLGAILAFTVLVLVHDYLITR